jgi:hypothetical protein
MASRPFVFYYFTNETFCFSTGSDSNWHKEAEPQKEAEG